VNAYTVLQDHHKVLKGLVKKITSTPAAAPERQEHLDDLLVELDIHFRIEDDLYYPALSAASTLIAVAHAEHRQVIDQLSVLLRTPPTSPTYDDEWHSFATVLEAHADEEERDMIPVPASVKISDAELVELGDQMATRIEELRESTVHKLRVKGRKTMLRAL
jgi:Hemerythrin HHE cation binding domain